jgi:eukaryotic-like serine/threonine-protein kinase
MSEDLRSRADRILQRALEVSREDRPALVDRECGGDGELRALVDELLRYVDDQTEHLDPRDALGEALGSSDLLPAPEGAPAAGDEIGAFRLVRRIGEGGMGEVWEAGQREPVKRSVAIKFLRPGRAGASTVARFESERRALALMQHPSIAPIHDAGTTPVGRPYLVMELVPGIPITEYCESHALSRDERIRLFGRVCGGVQHAHRRGIIHRDLKPSNVLVVAEDGEPLPKIIDFGLAKPTEATLLEETMTLDGQVIGTPAYMSPEQTRPSLEDIDTRTDVYALGAILYELLTGSRPHEGLTGASIDDVLHVIREVDPPLPSVAAVSNRGAEWARGLRGDLDWITRKALEKDRDRRYESPAHLAADLQRHLDGRPVEAGPPTARYRFGKFVRRHALAVGGAGVLLVLLVAFAVTLGIQNRQVARERDRAETEAAAASAVSQFLVELFRSPNPEEGSGKDVTAREILESGAGRVAEELAGEPDVQVRVMNTMGRAFQGLGDYERSAGVLEDALAIVTRELPGSTEHVAVLASLSASYTNRGEYAQAEDLAREALALVRSRPEPGADEEAGILTSLGSIRLRQGDREQGRAYVLESLREAVNPRHPELPRALNNLAILEWQDGNYEGARAYLERALSIWEETLGPEHPNVASTIANLALAYQEDGQDEASIPYHERAIAIREKALGPDHADLAESLNNYGNALRNLGRVDEALVALERALAIRGKALGPDHPYTATTEYNIGSILAGQGRRTEARGRLEHALSVFERSLGPDHAFTSYPLFDLALLETDEGHPARARDHYRRALEIRRSTLRPDDPDLGKALDAYADFERSQGNTALADSLLSP